MTQNPPQNLPMQDKEWMEDALNSQTFMAQAYNAFAGECTAANIRDEMLNILQDEHTIRADIVDEMLKRGWYPTAPADQQQTQAAKQKFSPPAQLQA